jgi:hypothetical protein
MTLAICMSAILYGTLLYALRFMALWWGGGGGIKQG